MRSLRAVLVVLLSVTGLVLLGPATAYACSCVQSTPRDYFERAEVVVAGRVVDRSAASGGPFGAGDTVRYLLEVDQVFKGKATERLELVSGVSGAGCGLESVAVDDRGVFFLYRADDASGLGWDAGPTLAANLCGGTGQVTRAQAARIAGSGGPPGDSSSAAGLLRRPEPGGPSRLSPTTGEWATYVGGGALVLLAAGWVLHRRRRLS
jgi:hypothetical protein